MIKFPTATQLARRREQEILDGYHDELSDEDFNEANEAWGEYQFQAAEANYDGGE